MNTAAIVQTSIAAVPGTTASGIASASQLVELTPTVTLRVDMTASPHTLIMLAPLHPRIPELPAPTPLTAAKYPVLAEIWGNEEDGIFDTI